MSDGPQPRPRKVSTSDPSANANWGSNFWVTLVDDTNTPFYACPATGQVSWEPPTGSFVLPPSSDGEWWELSDPNHGGLPYYFHTRSKETRWDRPDGFIIPLGAIQDISFAKRLSTQFSNSFPSPEGPRPGNGDIDSRAKQKPRPRRSFTTDAHFAHRLTPIPGSPYASDISDAPPSPIDQSPPTPPRLRTPKDSPNGKSTNTAPSSSPEARSRTKSSPYVSHRPAQPQSLSAAVELLASSQSESGHSTSASSQPTESTVSFQHPVNARQASHEKGRRDVPPSPRRPIPSTPNGSRIRNVSAPMMVSGKPISGPILNHAATLQMSPVQNRASSKPIPVDRPSVSMSASMMSRPVIVHSYPLYADFSSNHPTLPQNLVSDIQLFSESTYAKQYFSTHRTGFIFRRKVPVAQMMTWQKAPLTSSLLTLKGGLQRDAVKIFKVIQHVMGDRERERGAGLRPSDNHVSTVASINSSQVQVNGSSTGILEEQRWLLGEGLLHGELRDEIFCQILKQLTLNPNQESIFKGWQLMCVLLVTFPPSKNFETYLRSFIADHCNHQPGRIDVIARHCLKRLTNVSKKGPRGKPPTLAEIETASDAAFNPSTFGESLDAIFRLQERNYPEQRVPIILPFLADGILALGGTKAEGIFRVPGDGDSVSELKLRIDRGFYTLDGVDDPHILASLMKLWLRELCDPLVPEEMYNECITLAKEPESCVDIVARLPTINRRVVLFVISFLQLFLEERTQSVTKMTPANLALVMAPNLLRCNSDSMAVVFTNAQYEQVFVYNLLLHLKCGETDVGYTPVHGVAASKPFKAKSRRTQH